MFCIDLSRGSVRTFNAVFVLFNSEGSRRVLILGNERYLEGCLEFPVRENMLGNVYSLLL